MHIYIYIQTFQCGLTADVGNWHKIYTIGPVILFIGIKYTFKNRIINHLNTYFDNCSVE